MRNFVKEYLTTFINILEDVNNDYTLLEKYQNQLVNFFATMKTQNSGIIYLNQLHSNLIQILNSLLYDRYKIIFRISQLVVLIFQLICFCLNILSSILIFAKLKNSCSKIIGHISWFLAAFNLVILTLIIIAVYSLGTIILTGSEVFTKFSNKNEANNLNSESSDYIKMFKCFQPFDIGLYNIDPKVLNIVNVFNEFENGMTKINIFTESNPFNYQGYLNIINTALNELREPANVFVNNDGSKPVNDLLVLFNRLTDVDDVYSYQLLNDCYNTTKLEFTFSEPCNKYELVDFWTTNQANRLCLSLIQLNEGNITDLFQQLSCDDTIQLFNPTYSSLKEEIISIGRILTNFYKEYDSYRNFVGKEILEE
jgi:hypothetical protein